MAILTNVIITEQEKAIDRRLERFHFTESFFRTRHTCEVRKTTIKRTSSDSVKEKEKKKRKKESCNTIIIRSYLKRSFICI